jgi:hypothetical protein
MAEYVWWFLIVGLVLGGGLVAFFMADFTRRDADIDAVEREAEATLLVAQLAAGGRTVDRATVSAILGADHDYRRLPPPDRFQQADDERTDEADDDGLAGLARPRPRSGDRDADREADEVRDGGRGGADEDLPPA